MTFGYLSLAAIGLLLGYICYRTLGSMRGMGLPKKVSAALRAGEPQPFAGLRDLNTQTRTDVLWEVLRPLLLDGEFELARRVVMELEMCDPPGAMWAESELAEARGDLATAERLGRQLIVAHAANVHYRARLAEVLGRRGKYEEAFEVLEAGGLEDPVLMDTLVELQFAMEERAYADPLNGGP